MAGRAAGGRLPRSSSALVAALRDARARPRRPRGRGRRGAWAELLFTDYLFPFEVTSLLLLAAIVGVMALTKRRA